MTCLARRVAVVTSTSACQASASSGAVSRSAVRAAAGLARRAAPVRPALPVDHRCQRAISQPGRGMPRRSVDAAAEALRPGTDERAEAV